MPISLTGNFYLRLTSNGNLTGEFSNNYCDLPHTESADRIDGRPADLTSPDAFVGDYYSTWHEGEGDHKHECVMARLKIKKSGGQYRKFKLTWKDLSGNIIFEGVGILGEGLLIGNYTQVGNR